MLSKEKIEYYKEKLERERAQLFKEIEKYEKPEDFGADTEDLDEEADEGEEIGNRLAIAQVKRTALAEVEHALGKIEEGTYGVCDRCKGEISEKVFAAAPESALCGTCKKENNKKR